MLSRNKQASVIIDFQLQRLSVPVPALGWMRGLELLPVSTGCLMHHLFCSSVSSRVPVVC